MRVDDFDYNLPERLIAQDPLKDRAASRLLILSKDSGEIRHRIFREIIQELDERDLLVLNNTRVIPARLYGVKKDTGAGIELLLLKRLPEEKAAWECLVKPGKKCRPGTELVFGDGSLKGLITDQLPDGNRIIHFTFDGIFEEVLDRLGEMPLPPYITHKLEDRERYQTVYARERGSAAAPTAGLHFTEELLGELKERGIDNAELTLHVGLGTFRPVKAETVEEHHMHRESFTVSPEAAEKINTHKQKGGRIIAVGTTSCRTLESVADEKGLIHAGSGETGIFIYPGYRFKIVDGLITNFHLPKSTLMMLVSALAGRENIMKAYAEAIEKEYRFFSFGDAMLIR